jgi:hypothetical protein
MKDFLNTYESFDGRQTWDGAVTVYVPPSQAKVAKSKMWYGKVVGRVNNSYKNYFSSRDKRVKVLPVGCNSPALWGIEVSDNSQKLVDFCEDLGAEAVMKKLGLPKSWAKFSEKIIKKLSKCSDPLDSVFLRRLREWIACGGETRELGLDLAWRAPDGLSTQALREAHLAQPKAEASELVDIVRACEGLQVSLAEGLRAHRRHAHWCSLPRDGWVFCGIHKITLKKERLSLHDFLVDLLESVESRGDSSEISTVQELKFESPEGWEHVETPKKLINISRKNGWCSKLKAYWGEMKKGEMFFFCAEKGLAHYSRSGRLMQAKAPNNAQDLRSLLPEQLQAI